MRNAKYWQLAVLILSSVFIFAQTSYATTIDRIIIFGDSLSDNGNIYNISRNLHKVGGLVPIIPKNPPYYEGRFTNGPVWVEKLAQGMNVRLTDYAYGGAWVEGIWDSHSFIPFSLGMQVNYYLIREYADFHKDNHLYVIWAGANDYIQGRSDPDLATTKIVNKIKEQIDWLAYYGAKNFLVLTIPDISHVPEATQKGPDFVAQVKKLVVMHNEKLTEMLAKEREDHPNLKFVSPDIESYFTDLYTNPAKYNLKNVADACYSGGYYFSDATLLNKTEVKAAKEADIDLLANPSLRVAYLNSKLAENGQQHVCENEDEYLFWDQIHPTRIAHGLVAFLSQQALEANKIYGPDQA